MVGRLFSDCDPSLTTWKRLYRWHAICPATWLHNWETRRIMAYFPYGSFLLCQDHRNRTTGTISHPLRSLMKRGGGKRHSLQLEGFYTSLKCRMIAKSSYLSTPTELFNIYHPITVYSNRGLSWVSNASESYWTRTNNQIFSKERLLLLQHQMI